MSSLSTDAFPYTITYVCEQLGLDEPRILSLCKTLGIEPHRHERTGQLFFGIKDVERLQAAAAGPSSGGGTDAGQGLHRSPGSALASAKQQAYSSVPQRASSGSNLSRADLSAIVESVSNAKEEILRDLSQLLDDKLSGLDEVVVELIRSKSENDTLREALKREEESRALLEAELSKFKPAAFGFYRKEG